MAGKLCRRAANLIWKRRSVLTLPVPFIFPSPHRSPSFIFYHVRRHYPYFQTCSWCVRRFLTVFSASLTRLCPSLFHRCSDILSFVAHSNSVSTPSSIRFQLTVILLCSRRWRYRQDHLCQGSLSRHRFSDRVLIMAILQRHLTGEFEKKYIGVSLSFYCVFPTHLAVLSA